MTLKDFVELLSQSVYFQYREGYSPFAHKLILKQSPYTSLVYWLYIDKIHFFNRYGQKINFEEFLNALPNFEIKKPFLFNLDLFIPKNEP